MHLTQERRDTCVHWMATRFTDPRGPRDGPARSGRFSERHPRVRHVPRGAAPRHTQAREYTYGDRGRHQGAAGGRVHFGHQTRRWNPKMRRFIHGERSGIYIIDLLQTQRLLGQAQDFASELARRGGTILFVGTKKQARDAVKEVAESAGMPYVNNRWLGG